MNKLGMILLSCIFAAAPANAQFGIYGQYNGTHDSSVPAWYKGGTGGAYANLIGFGPAHLGMDLRATYSSGDQYNYRSFLIGPRLEVKPPLIPLRPYVQGSIGIGGNRYVGTPSLQQHFNNKLQYGVGGGLDFTLFPLFDLRLIDIQYLRMSAVTSGQLAPPTNLFTIGAGLVLRLP